MTPSPVYWGQEKFRDTNGSSVGFGKWFARIGHDSVRELPYTTRVNGNETEIVGYSYTATGTPEPEVGNNWYPVVIDSYTTAEYESLDAYLASEYGHILLASCGVTALVPLETAIQRLAENDINITVILSPTLFNRLQSNYNKYFLVNEQGQMVVFSAGSNEVCLICETNAQHYALIGREDVSEIITAWGREDLGVITPGQNKTVTVDGVEYTFIAEGNNYVLTPAAGTYNG